MGKVIPMRRFNFGGNCIVINTEGFLSMEDEIKNIIDFVRPLANKWYGGDMPFTRDGVTVLEELAEKTIEENLPDEFLTKAIMLLGTLFGEVIRRTKPGWEWVEEEYPSLGQIIFLKRIEGNKVYRLFPHDRVRKRLLVGEKFGLMDYYDEPDITIQVMKEE